MADFANALAATLLARRTPTFEVSAEDVDRFNNALNIIEAKIDETKQYNDGIKKYATSLYGYFKPDEFMKLRQKIEDLSSNKTGGIFTLTELKWIQDIGHHAQAFALDALRLGSLDPQTSSPALKQVTPELFANVITISTLARDIVNLAGKNLRSEKEKAAASLP